MRKLNLKTMQIKIEILDDITKKLIHQFYCTNRELMKKLNAVNEIFPKCIKVIKEVENEI